MAHAVFPLSSDQIKKMTHIIDDGIKKLLGAKFEPLFTNDTFTTIFFPLGFDQIVRPEDLFLLKSTFKAESISVDSDGHVCVEEIDKNHLKVMLDIWRL